ncbi:MULTISPECIES: ABC transporter ATP-binding protein [Streptosporangium]|uniref:ABC-type glutathione transport system ATPase component n=1 Tax=Streptosporangium brasiliense TaxID=47480 RepID=A0ABT9RH50_9ACTN|nr:ATP-binding cassette domain-containing protein [Streptosporangium brasiliense]MDP9867685.1 ABC-type glutathione transport system ATPase component [Streptosporangium brasiliense]
MIIKNLTVRFGAFTAVDDVTLEVPAGAIVGLVGESGSGKSTLARAVSGLVPYTGEIVGGDPRRIQMVFQDPYASLDPRMTVGASVAEGLRVPRAARQGEVERLLSLVSLPISLAVRYPRELSGGQRQRVAIARTLGADPELLVADEITSALDVSVQGAVLNLIRSLREELGLSMLFISHNLAVVRYVSDVVAVMHHGRLVEAGPTEEVVGSPKEAYTRSLIEAVPRLGHA